jgi:hypothetical protein
MGRTARKRGYKGAKRELLTEQIPVLTVKDHVPWRNCVSPQRFRLPVHHQYAILPLGTNEGNVRTCSQQVLQELLASGRFKLS